MPKHPSLFTATKRRIASSLAACASLSLLGAAALAGDLTKDFKKSVIEPEAKSRIHALLGLEFSDHYITPRGLNVENQGLVFQPIFLLFTQLYHSEEGFLNDVTLVTGVWNSIHEHRSGKDPSNHNETDPIAGLNFTFANNWEFDATYSAFDSGTDSYDTSHNLSLKLSYHDKIFGESFSINPYVEYWKELSKKDTVTFNLNTSDESWYFAIGINPTYKFKNIPLEISLPTYFNVCENDFYQRFDGTAGGSGVAVISTQLKATVPLKFIPPAYGFWSIYAAVQYYHLDNPGLLDGNQALNATSERLHNLVQFHGGLTIFF